MPEAVFDICADVIRDSRSCRVRAKQFDVRSRYLKVHITNRGRAVIVPEGYTAAINVRRPDGEAKAFSGVVNPDGTVTVPIASWALELEGELICDISVVGENGSKLTTTSFTVTVERSTYSGGDVSQDLETMDVITEVLAGLNELNNKMPNYKIGPGLAVTDNTLYVTSGGSGGGVAVDPTLSVEGLAADAKATGEAIKQIAVTGEVWDSKLFTVQPWLDGDVQIKRDPNGDAWGYCHTFTGLEPNTFYTISISEPDNGTCYIGSVYGNKAVTETGGYQSYMTDENGNLDIYLLRSGYWWPTESRYDDYLNGALKACLVKGTDAYFQGDNTTGNAWKIDHVKSSYDSNTQQQFALKFIPGNVHGCSFDFDIGGYYAADGSTGGQYPYAIFSAVAQNEATLNLYGGDSMIDLTMLAKSDKEPARAGITVYGNESLNELADFYLNFYDRTVRTDNPALTIRRNARPMDFTKDGIVVQNAAGDTKTVDLYELESRVSASDGYTAPKITATDYTKYANDVFTEDELNHGQLIDPPLVYTLVNSWDFTSGSLTDSIGGYTAVNTGCTLDPSGLTVGGADARCALSYGIITPGSAVEIDVASAQGSMEAGKHGRCFMFYEHADAGAIAAGLVYRHQTGTWAFYFNNWSNDLSSDKNLFNGKTVRLELDDNGFISMYVGGMLIGKSNVAWSSEYSGFAIGGYADSFYSLTVSAVRVYRKVQ